jgi:GNAT superfamily N-acetyltransferase
MTDTFTIRLATLDDVPIIGHHRYEMFMEMGQGTREACDRMRAPSEAWTRAAMEAGRYIGFFAEDATGQVVAGAGLWLMEWLPNPDDVTGRRGYILNVYTEPHARKRGLAKRLVCAAMDWCAERGISIMLLHASDAGRPIYESIGFTQTSEMRFQMALTPEQENRG